MQRMFSSCQPEVAPHPFPLTPPRLDELDRDHVLVTFEQARRGVGEEGCPHVRVMPPSLAGMLAV